MGGWELALREVRGWADGPAAAPGPGEDGQLPSVGTATLTQTAPGLRHRGSGGPGPLTTRTHVPTLLPPLPRTSTPLCPWTRRWLCLEVLYSFPLLTQQVLHPSSGYHFQEALLDVQMPVPFPHAPCYRFSLPGLCVTPSGSSPGPLPAASMSRNMHLRRHWAEMVCVLRKP